LCPQAVNVKVFDKNVKLSSESTGQIHIIRSSGQGQGPEVTTAKKAKMQVVHLCLKGKIVLFIIKLHHIHKMWTITIDDPASLSGGLNSSTSCLRCRFPGTQETLNKMGSPSPHSEGDGV